MSDARFVSRLFTYDKTELVYPERDFFIVDSQNSNSFGNRYERQSTIIASKNPYSEGYEVSRDNAEIQVFNYQWNTMFDLIEHGIFTGPSTLSALKIAATLIKSTQIPEEDQNRNISAWNGFAKILVSARVKAYMDLQGRVGTMMVEALGNDRANKCLLSQDWKYYRNAYQGWSRST